MTKRIERLTQAIRAIYENCQVQPEENVVVYSEGEDTREVALIFRQIAQEIGCDAIML
jgi:hypothetical protein